MKHSKTEVENAYKFLSEHLKPGSYVYTSVLHVARSGMSRDIKVCIVIDGEICPITYSVACLLGLPMRGNGGLHIDGCGMDMCFEVVYLLGRKLFPNGFKPSDAGKDRGRNGSSANSIDNDGGYALNYRSL